MPLLPEANRFAEGLGYLRCVHMSQAHNEVIKGKSVARLGLGE